MSVATLPPTTGEYWTVDDVPLNCKGWNVQSKGGRFNVPPLRGEDTQFAYVPGDWWLPKLPGPRTLTLQMWIAGWDPGTGAAVGNPAARWNDSWAFLANLLWQPDRQFRLTKRWWRTNPGTGQIELASATALGQVSNDLGQTFQARNRSSFEVDIKLADPFFYSSQQTSANIGRAATVTVGNPGDYVAYHQGSQVFVDLVGPLSAPRLTNASPSPDIYCGIDANVAAGRTLTLDVTNFVAREFATGSSTVTAYRTGEVYNGGTRAWFGLTRGANAITLSGPSGSGRAVVRFCPPYL